MPTKEKLLIRMIFYAISHTKIRVKYFFSFSATLTAPLIKKKALVKKSKALVSFNTSDCKFITFRGSRVH